MDWTLQKLYQMAKAIWIWDWQPTSLAVAILLAVILIIATILLGQWLLLLARKWVG